MAKYKVGDIIYGLDTQEGYTFQIQRVFDEGGYNNLCYELKYLKWPDKYGDLKHTVDIFNQAVIDEYFYKAVNYNFLWQDLVK